MDAKTTRQKTTKAESSETREIPPEQMTEILTDLRTLAAAVDVAPERQAVKELVLRIDERLAPINGRFAMEERGPEILRRPLSDDELPLATAMSATLDLLLAVRLDTAPADCGAKLRALADELERRDGPEPEQSVQQPYESEEQFRARLEDMPVVSFTHPMPSSTLARNLFKKAARQTGCIAMLLDVFSPARFLPAYWERFGLPDLVRECEYLQVPTRAKSLHAVLTDDEFARLRKDLDEVVLRWMRWRQQAVAAGIEGVRGMAWADWAADHAGLKGEWDDIGEQIEAMNHRLCDLSAIIEARKAGGLRNTEPDNGPGLSEEPKPDKRDCHNWCPVGLSKKEIGLALGLPDDKKIAEQVNALCKSTGILLEKDSRKKYRVALDSLPPVQLKRFTECMHSNYHVSV